MATQARQRDSEGLGVRSREVVAPQAQHDRKEGHGRGEAEAHGDGATGQPDEDAHQGGLQQQRHLELPPGDGEQHGQPAGVGRSAFAEGAELSRRHYA